ncbi:MAG TPA: PAS domain S-box protein [Solirubrobacteraceae bacterium]|nr:PAS domain S-box protein [Solirubrobacteraceae bacterium]
MGVNAVGGDAALHLATQQRVARELVRATSLEEAAPGILAAIGEALGWDVAGIWELAPGEDALSFVAGWEARPGGAEEFWRLSHQLRFKRGVPLPGRAWESGEPTWRIDLAGDPDFPRLEAAAAAGLGVGLAIPIPIGAPDDVLGVMEVFARHGEAPEPAMRELLAGFGDQLAQFLVRRRAEEAVRRSDGLKTAILESSLDCVVAMDHHGRITEWNSAAEATFGRRREDALGRELAEVLIPPALRQRHHEGLRRFLETGDGPILGQRIEMSALHADGREIPVELAVTALPGAVPPVFTGFIRDIGERRRADEALRRLASIVGTTDDAVGSLDLEGRLTSWNPGAERMYGYSAEEVLGRPMRMFVPEDRQDETGYLIETLRRGHSVEDFETERIRADGARFAVSLTLNPITDAAGEIVGISVIGRDITERRRNETAKEFLIAASAALEASLDPEQTLRTIVRTAVPELAALCVIDLLEEDGSIGRAVAAAENPEYARELEEIRARAPLDPAGSHPVAQVLRTGEPITLRDMSAPEVVEQVAQSDEHREFMRRAGYRSAAVVAMWARGRTLGAISFLHVHGDRRYDPEDLALLQDLASRAAMALDNARLYAERSHVAGTLQRGLLPAALPEPPGLEVAAAYRPAREGLEVGGDFYDAFEAGGEWVFAVGDVCGKGAEAAALTSLLRYSVRAFALENRSPSRVLTLVNGAMLREDLSDRFATAALARLDPTVRPTPVCLAVGGHPTPIILRADGRAEAAGGRGTLLGVTEELTILDHPLTLDTGDCLVLYTDGVLDAGAPRRVLDPDCLAAELTDVAGATAEAAVRRVIDVAAGLADGPLRDDIAVLALRLI